MLERRRRRIAWWCVGLGAVIVLGFVFAFKDWVDEKLEQKLKKPLVEALKDADRIEVSALEGWYEEDEQPLPITVEGQNKVREFPGTIDFHFSGLLLRSQCRCLGDTAFEFYAGDEKVATLTYHHRSHLRWPQGQWNTDVYLAADSKVELVEWVKKQGYKPPPCW